jgi:alkylhydroperoxidase family enzyme
MRADLRLRSQYFSSLPGRSRGEERVPDDLFAEISKHYDEKALSTLMVALGSAGFWMAVALILKPPPVGQEAESA